MADYWIFKMNNNNKLLITDYWLFNTIYSLLIIYCELIITN